MLTFTLIFKDPILAITKKHKINLLKLKSNLMRSNRATFLTEKGRSMLRLKRNTMINPFQSLVGNYQLISELSFCYYSVIMDYVISRLM